MRAIDTIAIHCSATVPQTDIGVAEIRKFHTNPPPAGRGWDDIGYHFVIRRNGTVENGRPANLPGAHVKGHNAHSIGICLVGGVDVLNDPDFNFTHAQMATLSDFTKGLVKALRAGTIQGCVAGSSIALKGHRQFDTAGGKACPCFDVGAWFNGMEF